MTPLTLAAQYARKNQIYMHDDTAKYLVIAELTTVAEEISLNRFRFSDGSELTASPEREMLSVTA